MKNLTSRQLAFTAGCTLALILCPLWLCAQPFLFPPQTSPDAQRNARNGVRNQINWFQNATRTASNFPTGGHGMVWQQFQQVRGAFSAFKSTLSPRQLALGSNDLAELEAGLDILAEAFANYEGDVAAGRSPSSALRSMCQVLDQASAVWLREFARDCGRLGVGF